MTRMDDRKRMLATALRDLAGWSVGMVLSDGSVVVGWRRSGDVAGRWYIDIAERDGAVMAVSANLYGFQHLADLDAPANWGVWLAWAGGRYGVTVESSSGSPESWEAYDGGAWVSGTLPSALLGAVVGLARMNDNELPPSVTAWWEAEQAGGES